MSVRFELPTAGFEWRFPGWVVRWIDGDTVVCHVALSPKLAIHEEHVRVFGVNTPELNAADPEVRGRALAARDMSASVAPVGSRIELRSRGTDKYGRLLADVRGENGVSVGATLLAAGLAVVA